MTPLQRSLLSTLALADAEGQSFLSLQEVAEYLHKSPEGSGHAPTLLEIARGLSLLARHGHVAQHDGRFALAPSSETAKKDFSEEKMRRAKAVLGLLSAVPFVRSLAITGSVSFGNAKESSDLDILLLAEKGHVWTVRLLSLAILEFARRRRDAQGKSRKICLNYFLSEDAAPPVQNIASAHMLKRAIPVFGTSVYLDFTGRNAWMSGFLHHPQPRSAHETEMKRSFFLSFLQSCGEFVLIGFMGFFMEKWARAWQQKRLQKKTGGSVNSSHFLFSDNVIMLHHPDPKNERVMARYKRALAGIAPRGPKRYNTKKKHEKTH